MQLNIRTEADFLHASAAGEFSLDEAKRTFLELLEMLARHKVKKALFDGREIMGEPRTLERYYYGEFAAWSVIDFVSRGVERITHFAYVLKEPVLDPQRFGETVAVNRGMFVKVFDNTAEALEWLRAAPVDLSASGS